MSDIDYSVTTSDVIKSYDYIYRKMTILWLFLKFHDNIFGSHSMAVLYPNLCNNEVCYKGTVLYWSLPVD